jgi:uncharacterized protein YggU (UPF0235/DUF167 family)
MEPPEGGRANGALLKLLRDKLGIKTIAIVGGETGRNKLVDFGDGVTPEWVIDRLPCGISSQGKKSNGRGRRL